MIAYFCQVMKKRRLIPDPVLMVLSIIVLAGFMGYWLKNNYDREKRNLQIKTNIAFQETVHHLQTVKLHIPDPFENDSSHRARIKVMVDDNEMMPQGAEKRKDLPRKEIITMVNAIRDKARVDSTFKATAVVTMGNDKMIYHSDSLTHDPGALVQLKSDRDKVFRFFYSVDSLQDSLKISEIDTAYKTRLKKDKIVIPYAVSRIDSALDNDEGPDMSNVVVGFVHPKTYHLELGNTFPYLLKRIATPVLFSIFLIGLTIISFVILYRSLVKQQRLAEIKNEFISNITHELKTPIATVGVAIEALRNFDAAQNPEKTKEYLDISAAELQRLSLLVDKVLKLSMFENKQTQLKKEEFDMCQLVNEVVQIMRLQFDKHLAKLTVQTSGDNFMIEADRLHITSVLYNLLDNALKYSSENPVIEIELSSLPGDILELKVKDNGKGIPKEYQSKVFDKFFRVPDGDRHTVKGYGLGLSYVKEIMVSHMGYITVESEPGKGSTFIIKLPRKEMPVIDFGDNRKIIRKTIKIGK
jgi:two-component system, OmpR family, phosphate regulon sensor histidine kinase PhoR